jgi:hypothetical protein
MKKQLIYWILLLTYGCSAPGGSSSVVSPGCPEQPTTSLSEENVKEISLNETTVTESGQASSHKSLGYTFTAKKGQKLSYRTDEDICIWIYSPDSQLVNGGELPQTGKYILQVSAPKGSKTFDLEMSIGTLSAPSSSTSSSPAASSSSTQTSSSSSTSKQAVDLTQDQALEIVKNWYRAKPKIFGPPFDRSLVDQLATGKLHYDTTKSDGSMAWLQNNDSYYTYSKSEITNVVSFSTSGIRPALTISLFENLTLYGPKGIDRGASGSYSADFTYFFEKANGTWKIYHYEKVR